MSTGWLTQEAQTATPGVTPQSQVELSVGGPVTGPQTSVSSSPTVKPPVGGLTTGMVTQVTAPLASVTGPTVSATGPTSAAGQLTPRAPHGITNDDPVQEPVRAKFISSPGYVVPAPSFSYSVLPAVNSAAGSSQQSTSTPVLKLAPPIPAAALQPPVPGQSLGNRPSFSYSIVSQANVSSATGQQFQPTTVPMQAHLQGGKFNPTPTAASLQPPVPGQSLRPSSTFPGPTAQNFPPSVHLPFSIPRGQISTSTSFSFSASSQPAMANSLEKNSSSNKSTSEAVAPEAGNGSTVSVSSQSTQSSASIPTSSSTAPAAFPSSSSVAPATPPFAARPGMPVVTTAIQPTGTDSSSLRPPVPSPVPAPSNLAHPAPQNIQQPTYPPYSTLPAMAPPPQGIWLHPPQAVQRAPFMPYPGVPPASYPLQMHGMPLPPVPSPSIQPPGVSAVGAHGGPSSTSTPSSQPGSNSSEDLPPPDDDKQANDLQKETEITKNGSVDSWTAHRTEAGSIYYYNSLTGESTYEKPANFKGEPEKIAVQPTPVSWEKLAGTDWTLVTTNDGKTYYYDTKNKVSSWQLPAEVAEMRKNEDSDSVKGNVVLVQNASLTSDKGSAPITLSAPAVQTGGRDSAALRPSGASASSSALDLIKKKLQDAGAPTASTPISASSGPAGSDLNDSGEVEAAVKGPQSTIIKDKVKDANGDGNVSDSSSDSDDVEPGPSKEECIIQFKEMLKERGVAPFSKWDKELPKIVFDPRFKAVPGYSARRAIFEQYVRTRAEEERKEKRAAQKAAIDGFKELLEEASEDIDHRTDYQTFRRKWGSDPRFEALDRKERELLLNEKILPLKKAVEEKIQTAGASFKSMLHEKTDITTASRWSRVKDSLRNDPRYKAVKHEHREILFNEYISQLKAAEDEAERAAKAKRDEQEKLKEREREMRKRKEREEQEMERVRLKVRRKDAVASYQALLVEMIKDPKDLSVYTRETQILTEKSHGDKAAAAAKSLLHPYQPRESVERETPKASWTESKPKLEKDPQNRAMNPDLGQGDAEKLFREHVKELCERCARDYRSLLAEVITAEAAAQVTEDGKTLLSSWSEAKHLLRPDPRYSKMPRKDRESLWLEYAEEMNRKQKSSSNVKDKLDFEGRNRTSHADPSRRSPRRSSHGRR